jgi:hypothetical protein
MRLVELAEIDSAPVHMRRDCRAMNVFGLLLMLAIWMLALIGAAFLHFRR